jgi:signal transduction histidine kinase
MTRRILLVLLAFTAAVLVAAVVPLTLDAANHDRASFIQATAGMVTTDAAIAQTRLDNIAQPPAKSEKGDNSDSGDNGDAPLVPLFSQVQQAGDGLLIFQVIKGTTTQEKVLAAKAMPAGDWAALAAQANSQGDVARKAGRTIRPVTVAVGNRVDAAMPVYLRGSVHSPLVGTVILARSTRSLNGDIVTLWVIYGTIAAVAMLGAALLAFGLARWVSRPVTGLDSAATRLADGDLASRAVVDSGPPELRRLAGTFNTMAVRLDALVHGNRAVIADVSHQLRTPLAALRLRLDLLAADTAQSDPDTAQELAGALEELARLSRLVDGLLAVARAENVVPVPTVVDLTEVASERVVAWHPVAEDRGITLEALPAARPGMPGPAVPAWIGEGHLEQILDNLIANALEALDAGRRVTVTATATAAGAQVIVADDGPGMSAEDRERAFLRFTTSNPNGTGLGLAIVHRLITSNGGTARLTETPGGGLTAVLDFPGVPTANGSSTLPMNAVPQEHAPSASASDLASL